MALCKYIISIYSKRLIQKGHYLKLGCNKLQKIQNKFRHQGNPVIPFFKYKKYFEFFSCTRVQDYGIACLVIFSVFFSGSCGGYEQHNGPTYTSSYTDSSGNTIRRASSTPKSRVRFIGKVQVTPNV